MDNIQSTPRNMLLGRLADLLQSGKSKANQYQILPQVPLIGGTGLGDLFMGKAPELVDDMSYDGLRAAIRGGNAATGGIGTYGARPAVADAALLGMDVAGLGKGLSGLSKKSATALYDKLIEGGTSLSRRDALKKLGAIAGSTAVAGTGVGALRKLSDNVVSEAVHAAPKVADNVAAAAAKNYKFNSLADYFAYIRKQATSGNASGFGDSVDDIMKTILKEDEYLYNANKQIKMQGKLPEDFGLGDAYEPILHEFSPQAKQEMKDWKAGVTKLNRDFGNYGGKHDNDWTQWMINEDGRHNETLDFLRAYSQVGQAF